MAKDEQQEMPVACCNDELDGLMGVFTDVSVLNKTNEALEVSARKLQRLVEQIVQCMAVITETRDMYTAGHQRRVSDLAVAIAGKLQLSAEQVKTVQVAGMLHDIGKISIPAEILSKPGKLGDYELGMMRNHVEVGYGILKNIDFPWPIAPVVHQHHERLDGSGFPYGLQGAEIMVEAQILAVADVVEAMSSHRPYRPSLGMAQAIHEIRTNRNILYTSEVVEACTYILEEGFVFCR